MNNKIIFIIGGARSGKSSFALAEASKIRGQKAYVATAEALDKEMRERIEKHKKERSDDWSTYEEPVKISDVLSGIKNKYSVILIDCLTLWLSNIMDISQKSKVSRQKRASSETGSQKSKEYIRKFINELEAFKKSSIACLSGRQVHHPSSIFVVSNEVGMGIVPDNELAREFRDRAGFLNQKTAEMADEVYLTTAGIPVKIKDHGSTGLSAGRQAHRPERSRREDKKSKI